MAKLILIYGEEDFLVERAAADEVALHVPDEVLHFNIPEQLEAYQFESQASLITGGRRAFIIHTSETIPPLPESEDDILIALGGKRPLSHPKATRTLQFQKLKSFADNNEVVRWILQEGERRKIDLSRVAHALFVNCGSCLRKLASEVEKLSILTPPGGEVTPAIARSVLCFSTEITPKNIIDSICEGHTVKALAFYERLQERNDETGWIIAYMQRHVSQQLRSDLLLESSVPHNRASEILGVHPFVFLKTFSARRGLWSQRLLARSLDTLCDLDILHKQGVNVRCGLELEIITLSEEAHARSSR